MKKNIRVLTIASISLAMVVLFVVFVNWMKPESNSSDNQKSSLINNDQTATTVINANQTDKTVVDSDAVDVPTTVKKTGTENLPRSLQGTEVDGEIIIDENKQLVVTYGLRRLFDYFLSAMGEETIDVINARVEDYIRSHTPEPAASSAVEIYYAYISYLQSLKGLEKNYGNVQMEATQNGEIDLGLIKQRRGDMQKLRQQFFDKETIDAFFAQEDSFEEYTVAILEISNNDSLTEKQKKQEKEDYISRMPETEDKKALVAYRQQQQGLTTLIERTDELKSQGANAEDIHAMRVELVGVEAAQRLAKVDKEELNFSQRFDKYQTNKQAIIAQFGADTSKTLGQINQLESNLFNDSEVKRLTGYEAVRNETSKKEK